MDLRCVFLFAYLCQVKSDLYDRYTGKRLESRKVFQNGSIDVFGICSAEVPPCNPNDYRSHDGSCNNLKLPSRGTRMSPFLRILPPAYSSDGTARVAKDGSPLPLARRVRTTVYHDGRTTSPRVNTAVVHGFEYLGADNIFTIGIPDYLFLRQYCCTSLGQADPRCMPIIVPDDDPYLRSTDVRCLNFTRAQTFQDLGCIPKSIQPEQINFATPHLDLHMVYGTLNVTNTIVRSGKDGLLRTEVRKGREMPLILRNSPACLGNENNETACYIFGDILPNFDLRLTTFAIFFLKEHNRVARALFAINPCWDDEKIYNETRKIIIATAQNLLYYEVFPVLFGRKNLVKAGLIQDRVRYVNEYDPHLEPLLYAETGIALRFFHGIIDGRVKLYDKEYKQSREYFQSNTLFRSAIVEEDFNLEGINRGSFFQKTANNDHNVDPDISETFFGSFFKAADLFSIDIQRSRDVGIRPYNDYREYCGLPLAKRFEDFADVMDHEKIDELRSVYNDVNDVDLLPGIFSERLIPGTESGPTLLCLTVKQFLDTRRSDRYWFERGDHQHAFSRDQLYEVRRTNMARLACDNADGVQFIQPQAFLNPMRGNEMIECSRIRGMDLSKWLDTKCGDKHSNSGDYYD